MKNPALAILKDTEPFLVDASALVLNFPVTRPPMTGAEQTAAPDATFLVTQADSMSLWVAPGISIEAYVDTRVILLDAVKIARDFMLKCVAGTYYG